MSKLIVQGQVGNPGIYVARSDYDRYVREGYAAIPDLVLVPAEKVVLEIDQDKLTSRPIGLADGQGSRAEVVRALGSVPPLLRPDEVVSVPTIIERTGRQKATISGAWKKDPRFPKPVTRLGKSEGYLWADILKYLEERNLPIKREAGVHWAHQRPKSKAG